MFGLYGTAVIKLLYYCNAEYFLNRFKIKGLVVIVYLFSIVYRTVITDRNFRVLASSTGAMVEMVSCQPFDLVIPGFNPDLLRCLCSFSRCSVAAAYHLHSIKRNDN